MLAAASIVIGMAWSFLPTLDYIDWMKIRKTATVENPLTGNKIPLRTIFSIYAIFMVAVIIRYSWRFIEMLRNGPPRGEHEIPGHKHQAPSIQQGDEAV